MTAAVSPKNRKYWQVGSNKEVPGYQKADGVIDTSLSEYESETNVLGGYWCNGYTAKQPRVESPSRRPVRFF